MAQLDPDSPGLLYRQVRRQLEHAIAAGEFAGRRLPSSRALAAELGLSRNTVLLAYQELQAEGFVSSYPRSGLVVNEEMAQMVTQRRAGQPALPATTPPDWAALIRPTTNVDLPRLTKPRNWHAYPYPFVGGQVGVDIFPSAAWLRSLRRALEAAHRVESLQDNQSFDDPLLVEQLCSAVLPGRGILTDPTQVLITTGSQEGLYLVASALVGPGTEVAVENPGYPDLWHIMTRAGARLRPLAVDESGVVLGDGVGDAALVCTTPSHHFPTNVTLSTARRRQLLQIAGRGGPVLIEDDYDSEFRYHGRTTPALKAMDTQDHVVYLGSFSKFLAPGLRMGFVVAAPELIEELRDRRRFMVRHPPGHLQRALALLIASGDYASSVRRARSVLQDKWVRILAAVAEHLGWQVNRRADGMSVWITGPPGVDARVLAAAARSRGVLIELGGAFFLGPDPPQHHTRLGFASIPAARIEPGIQLLAGVAGSLGMLGSGIG